MDQSEVRRIRPMTVVFCVAEVGRSVRRLERADSNQCLNLILHTGRLLPNMGSIGQGEVRKIIPVTFVFCVEEVSPNNF